MQSSRGTMEHSKHSKTCSIITGCGICAPVLGSEKNKYMDFWANFQGAIVGRRGQLLHLFVPTLCTISAKHKRRGRPSLGQWDFKHCWTRGCSWQEITKKSDNFNWRLGAAASFQVFVRYLCEFGLCGPQTQPKIAQLQSARWRACVRKVIVLQRSCPCPS